jgi:predicted dinucleotide-utilizing enzyme
MKIVILGCGLVGGVLLKLLNKEETITQIICCDLKHKEEKHGKLIFKKIDVSNKQV